MFGESQAPPGFLRLSPGGASWDQRGLVAEVIIIIISGALKGGENPGAESGNPSGSVDPAGGGCQGEAPGAERPLPAGVPTWGAPLGLAHLGAKRQSPAEWGDWRLGGREAGEL